MSPDAAFSSDDRIAVTGGSGFIGTNLVRECIARGLPVVNLDPGPPRDAAARDVWRAVDPLASATLERELRSFAPTHVFHLGARTDLHGRTLEDYSANVEGVRAIGTACAQLKDLRCVVFASSRLVCRIGYQPRSEDDYCPSTVYGESKVAGELIVREARYPYHWTILRPTSIWGPWFDVPYRDFFTAVMRGRYFHVRGHRVRKSFGYVGNTVHQLEQVAVDDSETLHGATLYLADYPSTDLHEMAELIASSAGARPVRTIPRGPLVAVARAGDLLQRAGWSEPPLTSFRLNNLLTEMTYDLGPLERVAGPLPYSLADGVAATVAWMRDPAAPATPGSGGAVTSSGRLSGVQRC